MLAAAIAAPASAQEAPILDKVEGEWRAEGATLSWSAVLGGRFKRIMLKRRMGTQQFEGIGHYRVPAKGAGETDGYWADSTGDLHPLSVTLAPDRIVTIWGRAGGKQGKSEYRLAGETLVMTDWLLTTTGWRQFSQVSLTRAAR